MTVVTHSVPAGAEVAMLDGVLRRRFILIKGTTAARHRLLGAIGRQIARRTERKERRALGGLWRPDPLLEGAAT